MTREQMTGEVRLPRPPGVLRRALAAHPRAVDIFIVVWYVIGCGLGALLDLAGAGFAGESSGLPASLTLPLVLVTVLRILAVAAALLFRRRYPMTGLVITTLALFGEQGMQGLANSVALLFLLYAVPVYRSVAAGWVGYGIAVVGSLLVYAADLRRDSAQFETGPAGVISADPVVTTSVAEFVGIAVMTVFWYLAIVMLGINLGNRRRYVEAIIDRAHQLARERDQMARLAVAEERSRIAREMHDIVAHSVSVMIALSEGASRAVRAAPDAAADAMERSAETGRTALAEMRRLLGALQGPGESGADLVPQPGISELPGLVQGFREAGLEVTLDAGAGLGDRGQELAVYRVVQEGLTNVLRYAGRGARAEVCVRATERGTTVEVRDHGRPAGSEGAMPGLGSGRGLAGLAERVRVFGGSIESGHVPPHEGRGWRVRATFPVNAAARGRAVEPGQDGAGDGRADKTERETR